MKKQKVKWKREKDETEQIDNFIFIGYQMEFILVISLFIHKIAATAAAVPKKKLLYNEDGRTCTQTYTRGYEHMCEIKWKMRIKHAYILRLNFFWSDCFKLNWKTEERDSKRLGASLQNKNQRDWFTISLRVNVYFALVFVIVLCHYLTNILAKIISSFFIVSLLVECLIWSIACSRTILLLACFSLSIHHFGNLLRFFVGLLNS